jgi:hypothetical protein
LDPPQQQQQAGVEVDYQAAARSMTLFLLQARAAIHTTQKQQRLMREMRPQQQ